MDRDLAEHAWAHISAERLLRRTHRLVAIPSPTGQERAVALDYAECLREAGLAVELDEEFPESPSVIGRWPAAGAGPVLQFDGHLDTIPTHHRPPTLDLEAGIVRGRGAADMKGGLAAVVEALLALREAGLRPRGGVLVTAHGLHEAPLGDQRTLRALIRRGIHGDAAIVVELGEASLPLAAKGMAIFRIEVSRPGQPMHEAEAPPDLPHPLWATGRLLARLEAYRRAVAATTTPLLGPESIFLGEVHGGDFYNRVPVSARMVGTHRYAVPRTLADLEGEYRTLCQEVARETGTAVSCTLQDVGHPFRLDEREPVVQAVRHGFLAATGDELPLRGINVVGNAADLVGLAGIPAVYHGVNQSTAHSDDEYVVAADLLRAARVYVWSILEYLDVA